MNGSTAKLIRKFSTLANVNYRRMKKDYQRKIPRPQRHEFKEALREEIAIIEHNRKQQNEQLKKDVKQVAKRNTHAEFVAPQKPAATSRKPMPWWRAFINWIKELFKN